MGSWLGTFACDGERGTNMIGCWTIRFEILFCFGPYFYFLTYTYTFTSQTIQQHVSFHNKTDRLQLPIKHIQNDDENSNPAKFLKW